MAQEEVKLPKYKIRYKLYFNGDNGRGKANFMDEPWKYHSDPTPKSVAEKMKKFYAGINEFPPDIIEIDEIMISENQ